MPEPKPEADFEVLEENWQSVQMFLRGQTQWRATMGGVLGLDYGALAWLFRLYEVTDQRAVLEDLQIMESAAMLVMNERGA
jgi:hypothetical protein